MEVKFLNQPKEVKLGDILKERLKGDFDEVYMIAGMVKDTGVEDIYENILEAVKIIPKINMCIGIDRKNTSKDMLMKLLDAGCALSVHINVDGSKVESRVFIFEKENGTSYIYVTGAKFSSGGLFENACVITEIKYDASEQKAFETAKNTVLQGVVSEFHQIDRDEIILLAEKGEIVARITERKIPRITEMYGASGIEQVIGEQVYDESTSKQTFNFDELADIEIDLEPGIVMRKNVELAAESEAKKEKEEREKMLKSLKKTESDLDKLYGKKDSAEESKTKASIRMSDEIDFEHMTTLIIESNKIIEKGAGAGEFRLPKSLADNMLNYFDGEDAFEQNKSVVRFDVLDNKDNTEVADENVEIIRTDKGISIKSEALIKLELTEGDIVRLIKEGEKTYKCEIIRKETEEYNIWSCYCVHSVRGQKRKYGVI